jgi:hypothetical protein
MRWPAPRPILKLNQQSKIRRYAGQPRVHEPDLPPCNFAVVSAGFSPCPCRPPEKDSFMWPSRCTPPKWNGPYLRPEFVVIKLSHRVGAGNLACYYCICYTSVGAWLGVFHFNLASKSRGLG